MSAKKLFSFSLKFFIKYILQQWYIYIFVKNVDVVACQNKLVGELFVNKYKFSDVAILPFFRLCEKKIDSFKHKEYDFCYISLAHPHKNHALLFEAMKILSDEGIAIRLAVTVESDRIELIDKINEINNIGVVKIDNLGVLPKSKVCKLYAQSKCLIFPSKEETFGLGLIEAVDMGLDVIAADLNYVYEVIVPSMVFNPDSAKMCANAIKEYMNNKQKKSISLINNEIDTLIHKLIKGQNNV
ncbi:MAG: glycosyltransferase [Erysipelotrichia bacterium]|nr:glycosyltransferase [Erysipelotrichia bacterium]